MNSPSAPQSAAASAIQKRTEDVNARFIALAQDIIANPPPGEENDSSAVVRDLMAISIAGAAVYEIFKLLLNNPKADQLILQAAKAKAMGAYLRGATADIELTAKA